MDPIPHLGNPEDQSLKEYIVTLKDFDDSKSFYKDMEEPGGNLYLPNREVECINRRPISRNTHYLLTYDEAAQIRNDPRVLTVELNPADLGFIVGTYGFEQTSTQFDKRVGSNSFDLNWGLLRCLRKEDIPNWGINGTVEFSGSLISDSSGRNVDVVIMDDGCPFPTTLEYQQNVDGTGYSRMVEYNWYIHNPAVNGQPVSNYSYASNRLQQHGAHTTGTVAGNTQGWARDANIYNLKYFDSIDYVREFHRNKPINPLTGVKNPTVMNNSWGYRGGSINPASVSKFTIRGVDYFPTSGTQGSYVWDANIINNIARLNTSGAFPARNTATDVDMIDAMAEGVIIVASAGNSYFYQDSLGGLDYDNTMVQNGSTAYIHRGSSPGAADGGTEATKIITSGAIGQHNEPTGQSVYSSTGIEVGDYKAEFSNYGPRIDVWAPGSGIQSIWTAGSSLYDSNNTPDPRVAALGLTDTINNNFKKCPGTSMSCPNTVGVLACIAEKYPRMTQADARAYLKYTQPETVISTNGGAQDPKDAGFSFNPASNKQMLLLQGTRMPTAEIGGFHPFPFPEATSKHRPLSGLVYPRKRNFHSYNATATFNLTASSETVSNGNTVTMTVATSNVPNGTLVPYIVTAKPRTLSAPVLTTTAVSGVYSSDTLVTGTNGFNTRPNTSNRITTQSVANGSSTLITNSLLGAASLAFALPGPGVIPFTGSQDDGFWLITLPWAVQYLGVSYTTIGIGTNTYITFGNGSSEYAQLSASNPPYPKIMISCADNSCQRIYYGTEGVAPNRTYRICWEGTASTGGTLGSPNMVYEAVFYENTPNQIDTHIGVNARWSTSVSGSVYPFSTADISVPLTGTVTVNSNTASLPITIQSTTSLTMNVRLGIFPAPNVNILVN
jgi:hypothetical protein